MRTVIFKIFSAMQNAFRYHKKSLLIIFIFMLFFLNFSILLINFMKTQSAAILITLVLCFINILIFSGHFFFSNKK